MKCPHDNAAHGAPRRFIRASMAAVTLSLLAGCVAVGWQKPDADATKLEADLQECRRLATVEAKREEVPQLLPQRKAIVDRSGQLVVVPAPSQPTDRFLREQDLTGICMRRKGYRLVSE